MTESIIWDKGKNTIEGRENLKLLDNSACVDFFIIGSKSSKYKFLHDFPCDFPSQLFELLWVNMPYVTWLSSAAFRSPLGGIYRILRDNVIIDKHYVFSIRVSFLIHSFTACFINSYFAHFFSLKAHLLS